MTYLLDTDVVVSYLNGRADAVGLVSALLPDGLAISAITYGEVYEGIHFGHDPARHMAGFRGFLRGTRVLDVNRKVAREYGPAARDTASAGPAPARA